MNKINTFLDKYQGKAQLLLRCGLAVVFLYAAISSFLSPNDWVGYLPHIATAIVPAKILLPIFSIVELILTAWLLSGVYVRLAAFVAALLLLGIIISNFSLLPISFRDIGLLFGALALLLMGEQKIERTTLK